jgi:hypothetical protein
MYDTILALTSDDVDKVCYKPTSVDAKESLYWEMSIEDKIEEREEIKGSPILSFEDFYSVIEESYKFKKLDEQTATTPANVTNKKLIDCCVKDSILGNTLVDCIGASGGTGETGDIEWKGNTKYTNEQLTKHTGIKKGDIYNNELLQKRLGKIPTQEADDISSFSALCARSRSYESEALCISFFRVFNLIFISSKSFASPPLLLAMASLCQFFRDIAISFFSDLPNNFNWARHLSKKSLSTRRSSPANS